MERIKLFLKSGKEQSIFRKHPWIFSGAIMKKTAEPKEGEIVEICSNKGEYLATGHYQPGSIAVRILSFENDNINDAFFERKIIEAIFYRKQLKLFSNSTNNAFRLINGESDGMPGLIVDLFNDVVVIQAHTVGMYNSLELISSILFKELSGLINTVYDKSSSTLPFKADICHEDKFLIGNKETTLIRENNLIFKIDFIKGQKTGFFLDQRSSRLLLSEMSAGKKVLNMFCYTGGFSVYSIMGGANEVHSVDSSQLAIETANENVLLNFKNDINHKSYVEDAFAFLNGIDHSYDIIILDPPAFAKHNNVLNNALQGYKKLNYKAIEKVKKGGFIFTFSCSQAVSKEEFRKSVFAASANTGRTVRIVQQLSQSMDHPISIYHPESEYLKGLILYVE